MFWPIFAPSLHVFFYKKLVYKKVLQKFYKTLGSSTMSEKYLTLFIPT